VNGLVVVCRAQPQSSRDLTLLEALLAFCGLILDVVAVNLPKAVTLRFNSHDKEVDWNVVLLAKSLIFLHKTDNYLSLFGNRKSILRVVEPLVIGIKMHLCILCLFVTVGKIGVGTTVCDT